MTDVEDKPKRKSVSFSEGQIMIDSDGSVSQMNGTGEKDTVHSHANGETTDPVDEVTDMFKDLAKKKKKKPKKEEVQIIPQNASRGMLTLFRRRK